MTAGLPGQGRGIRTKVGAVSPVLRLPAFTWVGVMRLCMHRPGSFRGGILPVISPSHGLIDKELEI